MTYRSRRACTRLLVGVGAAALLAIAAPGAQASAPTGVPLPAGSSTPPPAPPPNPSAPTPSPGIAPVPLPTTAPTPPPGPVRSGRLGSAGGAWWNPASWVVSAIDDWFRGLVADALNPTLALLGGTVLASPPVTGQPQVHALWWLTVGIANSLLVLLVIAGGALLMGHETLQSRYTLKDLLPRIVVGAVAANASLAVVATAVPAANALAGALFGGALDPAAAAATLSGLLVAAVSGGGIFVVLIGAVAAVLVVLLLLTFVVRVAALILLTVAGPLCLVGHALPQTESVARLWWRGLFACLGVQVAQALLLTTAVHVFLTPAGRGLFGLGAGSQLVDLLVVVCLLWLLLKLPFWAFRAAVGGRRGSRGGRMVRYYLMSRLLRAGSKVARTAAIAAAL